MIAQRPDQQYCLRCGSANRCAIAAGRDPARCWCMDEAPQGAPPAGIDRCLCQACINPEAGPRSGGS